MAKLLMIEDDAQLRTVVASFLRRQGYTVLEAENCREGLRLDQKESPDLVIVDHDLPDGNAFDILGALPDRESEACVILLTGVGTIDLAVRAIKAGAEHFLTKPVDVEALEILVKKTLDAQRERRRSSSLRGRAGLNPFLGKSRAISELERFSRAPSWSNAPAR